MSTRGKIILTVVATFMLVPFLLSAADSKDSVIWKTDNLKSIGGHAVTVLGAPEVIDTKDGKALQFNGTSDAIYVADNPIKGWAKFTVEVVFRPDADGPTEQRFFHMNEAFTESRVMVETRLTKDNQWFLDTFIQSPAGNQPQLAENFKHPIGPWYTAALVYDGETMRHYVNGKLEMTSKLAYKPLGDGTTSIGLRINKVWWYKGAFRMARFTPRVLSPEELLLP